jgi:uncharacterized RDD family membrane protein YckC
MPDPSAPPPDRPAPEPESKGTYGSRWWKYLLIYLIVGGAAYALVYFLFFSDGYGS